MVVGPDGPSRRLCVPRSPASVRHATVAAIHGVCRPAIKPSEIPYLPVCRQDRCADWSFLGSTLRTSPLCWGRVSAPPPHRPSLPDYELLRLIGRGSYGDVWIARSITGAYRAVKVVWRSRFDDAQPYEREFKGLREFAAISLEESRQLALLHVSRTADFFYYVMELADDRVRGRDIDPDLYEPHTLKDLVDSRQVLPASEVLRLAIDLTQALAGLHAHGLVHRDIKPSNVIFVSRIPKLADIGLVATASAELTFVGTEGYVPPEGPGAPSADVYSLGKVLYELATGLDRKEYPRLPPDLLSRADRKAFLELNEVIIRACSSAPAHRHLDALALLEELRLLQAGKSMRRLRRAERQLGRALRLAAVCAVAAAIAGIGAWVENQRAARAEAERDALRRKTHYISQITQARIALDEHDYGGARKLLAGLEPKAGEEDLRGIEWSVLTSRARGAPASVLRSEGPAISALREAPDGKTFAVHDASATLELFDAVTHRSLRKIEHVFAFAGYTPDGRWLVGTSKVDGRARATRWSVGDASPRVSDSPPLRPLLVCGPDELVGFVDGLRASPPARSQPTSPELVVWDFARSAVVARVALRPEDDAGYWEFFRGVGDSATSTVALALLSGRQATARYRLVTWSRATPEHRDDFPLSAFVPGVLYLADDGGRRFACAHDYVNRQHLRRTLGAPSATWVAFGPAAPRARFSALSPWPDVVLAAEGPDVVLRRPHSASAELRRGHGAPIAALIALGNDRILSGSEAGELRLWRLDEPTVSYPVTPIRKPHGASTSLSFSPDGTLIYAPIADNHTGIFSRETLAPSGMIAGMSRPLFAEGDHSVWGLAADQAALVRAELTHGRIVETLPLGRGSILQAAASADRQRFVVITGAGELAVAGRQPSAEHRVIARDALSSWSLSVDPAGTRAWFVNNRPAARCFDLSGAELWQVPLPAIPSGLHLSADRKSVAVALENGSIELRDAQSGALLRVIMSGRSPIQSLSFVGSQPRLVATSADGIVRVIDPESGATLARLTSRSSYAPHTGAVSADGHHLALITQPGLLETVPLR